MENEQQGLAERIARTDLANRDVGPRAAADTINRAKAADAEFRNETQMQLVELLTGAIDRHNPDVRTAVVGLVNAGMADAQAVVGWRLAAVEGKQTVLVAPDGEVPEGAEVFEVREVIESRVASRNSARASMLAMEAWQAEHRRLKRELGSQIPGSKEHEAADFALHIHDGKRAAAEAGAIDHAPLSPKEKAAVLPTILKPFMRATADEGLIDAQVRAISRMIETGDLAQQQVHYLLRGLVSDPSGGEKMREIARLSRWTPGQERPTRDTLGIGWRSMTVEELDKICGMAAQLRREWGPSWTVPFSFYVPKGPGSFFEGDDGGNLGNIGQHMNQAGFFGLSELR